MQAETFAAASSVSTQRVASRLSLRVAGLHASPIREILAVIDRPGMVSFAGGLPAADTFPVLPAQVPSGYLQYGPTEGEPQLRQLIAERMQQLGLACDAAQVLILSGSQQGIDLVAKLFIDPGTPVAVEAPTYLAALQVFRFFGAELRAFQPGAPQTLVAATGRPSLLYAVPTFQNPTGYCYSAAEREAVASLCDAQGITLFEDDPYRDLCYQSCDRQPICTRLRRAGWVYQSSFSKTLAPGLRLGFLVASPELMPQLVRLKQAADLHSNRLSQYLVMQELQRPDHAVCLQSLAVTYRERRDVFAAQLTRHFADLATWEVPAGGLFFWLRLRVPLDTCLLLQRAIDVGVAFMPGESFYPHAVAASGALRLNFTHAAATAAEVGLAKLADLVRTAPV